MAAVQHDPVDPYEWPAETDLDGSLPPLGWRHPITGRRNHRLDPGLIRVGTYFRRARYIACRSQQSVGDEAHVTQSIVSRFERGLAPSMDVEKLVWLSDALEPNFPLGYCPHDHVCPWQPIALAPTPRPFKAPANVDFDALGRLIDARAGLIEPRAAED